MTRECPFEGDVLDALASKRWPAKADAALRAHVAECEACGDLASVAGALLCDEEVAYAEARVPAAAAVWHRAQLRARDEAVRAAMRPIGFVQGVALAGGLAAAITLLVWSLPVLAGLVEGGMPGANMLAVFRSAAGEAAGRLRDTDLVSLSLLSHTAVQLALVAWALLAPAALYFAFARD